MLPVCVILPPGTASAFASYKENLTSGLDSIAPKEVWNETGKVSQEKRSDG